MIHKSVRIKVGDFLLCKFSLRENLKRLYRPPSHGQMSIGAITFFTTFSLLIPSISMGQELTASWYGIESLKKEGTWKYSKGVMANGRQFSDHRFTAASWDYALGTKVKVTRTDNKACVVVLVTDRTARRFKGKRIDLSLRAFAKLDKLSKGLIKVRVEKIR